MNRVLVTGAYGFIGSALCNRLRLEGYEVRKTSRRPRSGAVLVEDIGPETDWSEALRGVSRVVHLAARVHIGEGRRTRDTDYMRVNAEGTAKLAQASAACDVERFVFMSSISVAGPSAPQPLREDGPCRPATEYARSKHAAELALASVGREQGLGYVIVRAPVVYGAGDPGNMNRLIQLVRRGFPLPLGAATERKSLIYVENLVDFLVLALERPNAAPRVFHVADEPPIATSDLVRLLSRELAIPSRVFAVPYGIVAIAGRALGRGDDVTKMFSPLVVDATRAREILGWSSRIDLLEGLRRTIAEAGT